MDYYYIQPTFELYSDCLILSSITIKYIQNVTLAKYDSIIPGIFNYIAWMFLFKFDFVIRSSVRVAV
jgi:hypothetical protein